jgi:hypothetical protein
MHRSGTSAATRLVNLLGLALCTPGDMVRGPWNPRGHWESRSLMHLDDDLLAQMGRTWWYPPPAGADYTAVAAGITTTPAQARRVFRQVHRRVPWVWKDPRASVLVPFWRSALGPRLASVIVFRNPLDVAVSLGRRHGVPVSFGVALWERYNRLLLAHARGLPVLVTRYDDLVVGPVAWCCAAREFLLGTGLRPGPEPAEHDLADVVDPELRHSAHSRSDVADQAPGAFAVLEALEACVGASTTFEPPALEAEPDGVEAELATVGPHQTLAWRPPPWAAQAGPAEAAGSEPWT